MIPTKPDIEDAQLDEWLTMPAGVLAVELTSHPEPDANKLWEFIRREAVRRHQKGKLAIARAALASKAIGELVDFKRRERDSEISLANQMARAGARISREEARARSIPLEQAKRLNAGADESFQRLKKFHNNGGGRHFDDE